MDIVSIRKAFGARVKRLRKQKKWTQKELAKKLETRFSMLNKYECGLHIPPADKLIKLAEIFETTVDYLLTGDHTEERPLHNIRLVERLQILEQFQAEDMEAVLKFLDAFIVKAKMEGTLKALAV